MSIYGHMNSEKQRSEEVSLSDSPSRYYKDHIENLTLEETQRLIELLDRYYHKCHVLEEQHNRIQRQYQLVQRKYVDLFYFSPIGYFIADRQGKILEANLTATNAVGHSSTVVIGKSLVNFVVEMDLPLLRVHYEALFQGERRTVCEVMLRNKLNVPKYVRLESMLWPDEYGNQTQVITAVIDITIQKEFDEQIKQQSKSDSLESLVGHIAHDFNNVIHSIISNTEYLVWDASQDENRSYQHINKRLKRILDLSARATESINGLLKLSTESAIVPKQIDLWPFFMKHQAEFEKYVPKKIALKWDIQHGSFIINADEEQLRFVIISLILNAVNHMPLGGELSIELLKNRDTDSGSTPHLEDEKSWNIVKLSCSPIQYEYETENEQTTPDQVPYQTLNNVFKIPQVSGIMRQHEGMVRVVPHPHGRAIFLYFPLVATPTANEAISISNKTALDGAGKTILIVEDDVEVMESFRETLEYLGFSVKMAVNGKEALKIYQSYRSSIELIITDLVMPEMDGELFLSAVKAIDPDAKVIATSGYPMSIQVNDLYQNGVFSFVQKPFTIQKISRVIQNALEAK